MGKTKHFVFKASQNYEAMIKINKLISKGWKIGKGYSMLGMQTVILYK